MRAGLPKAPSRDNPLTNAGRALERRNYVLRRMHGLGHIDDAELQQFRDAPLTASKHAVPVDVDAPYVAEMFFYHMLARYGEEADWRGFKGYTTVSGELQQTAQGALRAGLKAYDRRHGYRGAAAHVDIDVAATADGMDEILKPVPSSAELIPAVVVDLGDKEASVYAGREGEVKIPWDGMAWARR